MKIFYKILLFSVLFGILLSNGNTYAYDTDSQKKKHKRIDSLRNLVQLNKEDTVKVDILNTLASNYFALSPDSAFNYFDISNKLARKIKYNKGLIESFDGLARYYWMTGDYSNALKNVFEKLKITEQSKDKEGLSDCYGNLGVIYSETGDYKKALTYFEKSLVLLEKYSIEKDKPVKIIRIQGNIGNAYKSLGDYPKALKCYFEALKLSKQNGNPNRVEKQLGNIGIVYYLEKDYPKAIDYYEKALQISDSIGNTRSKANHLANIGIVHSMTQNYNEALNYYMQALKLNEEMGDKSSMGKNLGNIGNNYKILNDYESALTYYLRALHIDRSLGRKDGMAVKMGNLGSLYKNMGNFYNAQRYLDSALIICKEVGSLNYSMQFELNMSLLYDTLRQHKQAYQHYKLFSQYKDSLFNEAKSKDIGRLEQKHEFEIAELQRIEEEEESKRLALVIKNRRNILQYSAILLVILSLFIVLLLSKKLHIPNNLSGGSVFFIFLLLFEFILVLIDPYVDQFTKDEPALKLLLNAILALLIFPLHSLAESKLKERLFGETLKIHANTNKELQSKNSNTNKFLFFLLFSVLIMNSSFFNSNKTKETKLIPIDSLRNKLKEELSDTNRIETLLHLSRKFQEVNLDTAIIFAHQALELAKSTWIKSDKGWDRGIANSFHQLGIYQYQLGNYPLTLKYYFEALQVRENTNNDKGIALTLGNIGLVYLKLGDYKKAIEYHLKALTIDESLDNQESISRHLGNLGNAYYLHHDYPKAKDYFYKALKIARAINHNESVARHLSNLGNVYRNEGNYPKSLENYLSALEMATEMGLKNGMALQCGNISTLYAKMKRPFEAVHYIQTAIKLAQESGYNYGLMKFKKAAATLYFNLGTTQKTIASSAPYFQLAYANIKEATEIKDSLFNEKKARDIGRIEQKHELELEKLAADRITQETKRMQDEEKFRGNLLQYSSILLVFVGLFVILFYIGNLRIPQHLAQGGTFLLFLLFFEFLLVLADPYVEQFTAGEPAYTLVVNALLAALIFPLHSLAEGRLKRRLFQSEKKPISH